MPLITISVCTGVSTFTPLGILCTTGCENPSDRLSLSPAACARYPTPTSASFFSYPSVTPLTMFATSARKVPCIALASALAAVNTSVSPSFSTVIAVPNWRDSVPSGPLTEISPGPTFTSTFGGNLIGLLPMRDMFFSPSRDDAQHFAADAGGARLAIGHNPVRRRDDGDTQSVHHARDIVLALVNAQTRLRYALDFFDHRPAGVVLQRDLQLRLGFVAHDGETFDVALVLEHFGDRQLDFGCGHLRRGLFRELRIADARQHIGDRISHTHVS